MSSEHNGNIGKNFIERCATSIIFILIFLFFIAITYRILNKTNLDTRSLTLLNDIILFWTGVVIIVYTHETYRLRNEAQRQIEVAQRQVAETQRQTEIQQRPFVVLDVNYTKNRNEPYETRVKNLGNGTAINVRIKDVKEISTDSIYSFPNSVPILSAGQCSPIECRHIKYRGGNQRDMLILSLSNLYYPHTQEILVIMIEFKNIEGQPYFMKETISRNGLDFDFGKL